MHEFNTSLVVHFYIIGLTSWIRSNPLTEALKFESLSKWNSYEDFNLEYCLLPKFPTPLQLCNHPVGPQQPTILIGMILVRCEIVDLKSFHYILTHALHPFKKWWVFISNSFLGGIFFSQLRYVSWVLTLGMRLSDPNFGNEHVVILKKTIV